MCLASELTPEEPVKSLYYPTPNKVAGDCYIIRWKGFSAPIELEFEARSKSMALLDQVHRALPGPGSNKTFVINEGNNKKDVEFWVGIKNTKPESGQQPMKPAKTQQLRVPGRVLRAGWPVSAPVMNLKRCRH